MKTTTLALLGSGEFTPSMREVDSYIFRNLKHASIAILPTAAGKEADWWKWVDNGIAHFKTLGMHAFGLRVQKIVDANDDKIVAAAEQANAFYISGGDPGYLLSVLRDSLLWERVRAMYAQGAPLVGSSAGAMVLGGSLVSNIYAVFDRGEKKIQWEGALGVVPHTIWPHFDYAMRQKKGNMTRIMKDAPKDAHDDWLGIDEDTAVIWEGNDTPKVQGRGKAHWGEIS